MRLTVVIVNYNVRFYLGQCLDALRSGLAGIEHEVFVVDNNSSDGSVEALAPLFPEIKWIRSRKNLGFARANNIAIRQSTGTYVLLLNPDTVIGEHVLVQTLAFAEAHPKGGAYGVRMLHTDGSDARESRRGVPDPWTAFYKMCGLCNRYPESRRFGHYYMGGLPWDQPGEIEVVSGAFCLLRKEALNQVGLLDEDFFMYGEDIDLSYRLLKGGWHNYYLPQRILHYKGESTEKSSFRYVHVFYEAMLIFFRKHYGHLSGLLTVPIQLAIGLKSSVALVGLLMTRGRRSMGFSTGRSPKKSLFLLIGKSDTLEQMKKKARSVGLEARAFTGDEKSLPEGHHNLVVANSDDKVCYVVYATDSYSYETVFRIFAQYQNPRVKMAFYHLQEHLIITEEGIY